MKIPVETGLGQSIAQGSAMPERMKPDQRVPAALGNMAKTVGGIAGDMMDEEARQRDAADRLTASTHALKVEAGAKEIKQYVTDALARGELATEDDAAEAYRSAMDEAFGMEVPKLGSRTAGDLQVTMQRIRAGVDEQFAGDMRASRVNRAEAQFLSAADALGKQVKPGADLAGLEMRLTAARDAYVAAGGPVDRATALGQQFTDQFWFNDTQGRLVVGKDDMGALRAIEHDLTAEDGKYVNKLDAEKRNAALAQVLKAKDRLTAKWEAAAAKREAAAGRALQAYQMDVDSTLPVSAEVREAARRAAKGTPLEEAFNETLTLEREVSVLASKPVAEQKAFLLEQQKDLYIGEGSATKKAARFRRLANAFEANIKALTESPIETNETRTGERAMVLAPDLLMNTEGIKAAVQIMRDRTDTLAGMRRQYGTVGNSPLKRAEAEQFGAVLKAMSSTDRAKTLGVMAKGFGDPEVFKGAVKQMLGDDPNAYVSGLASGLGLQTNEGRRVGDLIEQGAVVLRDKSVIIPKAGSADDGTKAAFNSYITTDMMPAGGTTRDSYYQASLSIYAKLAAEEGKLGRTLDDKLFKRAVRIAVGGVVEYRGQPMIAPKYGMSEDEFSDKMDAALADAQKRSGFTYDLTEMRLVASDTVTGRFFVMADTIRPAVDKTGNPIFVEVK